MIARIKQKLMEWLRKLGRTLLGGALDDLRNLVLHQQTIELQSRHPNPLNRFGKKCFSQTDEDGITLEIVRRLGLSNGFYVELGVGNGLENNTLILAASGWRGFWLGGEELAFEYKPSTRFKYIRDWISLKNINQLVVEGLRHFQEESIDLISLDLDGNDIYFVESLLTAGHAPKVFIVEYNAKFPPPVLFQIAYDPEHYWRRDDYYGASLSSYVNLFSRFGFTLICCNSHTGANAFFVRDDFLASFDDVPRDVEKIYVGPRYFTYTKFGHKNSPRVVERIFLG